MEMIRKVLGTKKTVFHYKKPDISKRKVSERYGIGGLDGGHTITHKNGLYNQNLTVDELSLLRALLWEGREVMKDSWEFRRFTELIHSWMFTKKKDIVLFQDILKDFEEGVNFEGKLS